MNASFALAWCDLLGPKPFSIGRSSRGSAEHGAIGERGPLHLP